MVLANRQCFVVPGIERLMFRTWRAIARFCSSSAKVVQLKISETCAKRLKQITAPGELLRVFVDSGGCSGFEYKFELVTDIDPNDDVLFDRDGQGVVVDKMSLQFLNGATIDFHEELIRSTFRVVLNPNAEKGCSCGSSFAVKQQSGKNE